MKTKRVETKVMEIPLVETTLVETMLVETTLVEMIVVRQIGDNFPHLHLISRICLSENQLSGNLSETMLVKPL